MTTETDRELLELAANAAGYELSSEWDCAAHGILIGTGRGDLQTWDPLNDDGDALRLAVKLQIHITQSMQHVVCRQADQFRAIEIAGDDREKATRLAIVRAAADIGRAMK